MNTLNNGHGGVLLAAMLNGQELRLDPEDFSPPNRTIFNCIRSLSVPRSILAVQDQLIAHGDFERVGGYARMTEIACFPTDKANVDYAFEQVLAASRQKKAAKIGERMQKLEITPEDALKELAELAARRYDLPRIRFFTPCELRDFKPDNEVVLIGDCHVIRGEVFVIGGEPGVGKSLGANELAVSGATGRDWLGLKVHRQFRTLIVQTENGRYRLRLEFSKRNCDEIENWVRISEPPPFGLTLTNTEFQADIRAALDSFKPECVIFDPWNAAARDDKQRDYVETFDALRNLLPTGSDKPALGVIAHTKKPQAKGKRTGGTGLMHLLAGSYVLTSVPRSIFIMTRGSEDETDNSVVLFNPKNSNGQNAPRSAWIRALNGFTPATNFDWSEFDQAPEERKIISLDQISKVFDGGKKLLYKHDAAHDLATIAGVRDTSAYRALKLGGKFAEYLSQVGEKLKFSLPNFLRSSHFLGEILSPKVSKENWERE